ncbi:hypothetical protein [Streptomyces sp. NPDC001903]|uniref:hypothetical protein n=1 Tax=Streptomyces sp. NPDC001903 TaxID=3364622 RepID=UPI00369B26FC
MDDLLPLLAVFGGLGAVVLGLAALARRVRARGSAGAAIGAALASWEEAYRVTSHEAYQEVRAQTERQAPALSPDGPWHRRPAEGVRRSIEPRPPRMRRRTRLTRQARRMRRTQTY